VTSGETPDMKAAHQKKETHLRDLDEGRFADAIPTFLEERKPPSDDTAHLLWWAEVALYLGKLDEVHAAIGAGEKASEKHLEEATPEGALARRRRLLKGEMHYFEQKLGKAEELVAPVVEIAGRIGDTFAEMRARYDLGRFARRRSEYALAIERLAVAAGLAASLKNDFYSGLIAFNRGISLYELNEMAAAERRCLEAVTLLTSTEDLRYRALAQNTYGGLLTDLGRYAEALSMLERAETTIESLGIQSDLQTIRGNVARVMFALGRYDETVVRLEELIAHERGSGHHYAEFLALSLLSRAELGRDRHDAARRAASEALRLSGVVGTPSDLLDARLLDARAKSRAGREGAADDLKALLADVDRSGSEHQRAEARIYLAEACIFSEPVDAERLIAEARRLPIVASTEWLRTEMERVERERLGAPVRVAPDGTLVVDIRSGWPTMKQARDALERYLVTRALTASNGNGAAAGRLIGETRYQMHYLKRIFERGEGRPSRAMSFEEGTPEAESSTARRSASRPKRLVRRR
jgi:tetratricopeptide (TPR) repeat protein